MENGKENPVAKMLLQMLSIGAEMENSQRKIRQLKGIQLAKIKGVYNGRVNGAKSNPSVLVNKYQNISDLLDKSDLSIRRIALITGHSVNTVQKIKQLKRFELSKYFIKLSLNDTFLEFLLSIHNCIPYEFFCQELYILETRSFIRS